MFKSNLKEYYEHFNRYPNSLIAKILGVYTIKFDMDETPKTIILIENIAKVDK